MNAYDDKKIVGERLSAVMKERNVRAVDMSKSIGISPSTISRWISGEILPKYHHMISVCNYLNVDPMQIIGESELQISPDVKNEIDYDDIAKEVILKIANVISSEEFVKLLSKRIEAEIRKGIKK